MERKHYDNRIMHRLGNHRFQCKVVLEKIILEPRLNEFGLQQAWLVCRQPLPTCGAQTDSFKDWEPAGCLCEDENQTRTCINGYYSQDSDAIVSTRPEVYWRLDGNSNEFNCVGFFWQWSTWNSVGCTGGESCANPDDVVNGSTIFLTEVDILILAIFRL
jgi:hypothetical protein